MDTIRWVIINALAITIIHAAPRELNSDELITQPRPGEEYVNIQTSQNKANYAEQSFTTSHRIPQKKVSFETSHKIPPVEIRTRELVKESARLEPELTDNFENLEASKRLPRYDNPDEETASNNPVEVVTRTSVKMSKSKKVQKTITKPPQEIELDIKSNEGLIDETAFADKDVKEVMAVKYKKNENEEDKKPLRFNVPFEDEVEVTEKSKVSLSEPVLSSTGQVPTTAAPPITTFNYKNVYETSKKVKEAIQQISGKNSKTNADKLKNEILPIESIKTAESRTSADKKDTKQEKKIKLTKKEEHNKQVGGFYVLPVNKVTSQVPEDNYDFVDLDEKVLESAGSSPGQSSRINIKKGPNGQEYEYVYYYYYYDDDDEGKNNGAKTKEEKTPTSTTEKVYNGHDGPAIGTLNDNENTKSSTSGSRYLPTESSKSTQKSRKKTQQDDFSSIEERDESPEVFRGNSDNTRYTNFNRQPEPVNNEILPTTRLQSRSRGRITNVAGANPVPADDIPSIGEERLPANTRFPPRSRNNFPTSPQPQETTTRTRNRESNFQSRVRLPNLGLLDSSSFRTHSSDASIDEDPIHDAELHRRPTSRTFATETTDTKKDEITTLGHRRIRPTTPSTTITTLRLTEDSEVLPPRRVINSRPLDERIPFEDDEEDGEEVEKVEKTINNSRRLETTRESDAEEDDFSVTKIPYPSAEKESSEVKASEITTEDDSAIGLTNVMMEKVALDLYAILQQAQNENIQTNFIDGNSTDISTEEEILTEVTTFLSTTSTTTTETTTTETTTTTQAPTTAPGGRLRYRTRGGAGVGPPKTRTKTTTTTTTEVPAEPTSQRTRGRFQPNANRNSNPGSSRRITKPKVEVEESVSKEAPKPAPERTFGGRNRLRGTKSTTTTSTTSSPTTISGAAAISGNRGSSLDRYNARRRGSRLPVSTTNQPIVEDNLEIERQEVHQEGNAQGSLEETTAGISVKPNVRNRINTAGARPLRPGPRVPLNLPPRGRLPSTTTSAPVETEIGSSENKDAVDLEQHALQDEEEPVVTPPSDPLSRLKNRPRLRIGPTSSQQRTSSQSPVTPPANRRKLVSSLLPKRKTGEEKVIEKVEEAAEERNEEELYDEEISPSSTEPSSTTEADNKGLSGLLNGRRRNLVRRPGTIYSRSQQTEAS